MIENDQSFSGVSEQKYVLLDILEKNFSDRETGEKKPYYEIWVKNVSQNRILKFKPENSLDFSFKFNDYVALKNKQVMLKISAKEFNGVLFAVISDILPIL